MLFHGREANLSGSWDYILTHDDDYLYASVARGYAQTPISDGNAHYYEERGRTNSPLDYAAVAATGLVSRVLDVPVPTLLIGWKILVPFLTWVVLWLCLRHYWGVRSNYAAAFSLVLMTSTFFLHGSGQFTVLRFSHPADSIWLVTLWACLIFCAPRNRNTFVSIGAVAFATIIVAPYYAIVGAWLHGFRLFWDLLRRQHGGLRWECGAIALVASLCVGRLLLVLIDLKSSRYLQHALNLEIEGSREADLGAVALWLGAALAVGWAARWRRSNLTTMDGILLGILAMEPLAANTQAVLGNDHQMSMHRYYLLIFEFAALVGWLQEKLPSLIRRTAGTAWDGIAIIVTAALVWVLVQPELNWFRYLPRSEPTHFVFDNDTLILGVLPLLLLMVWMPLRFKTIQRFFQSPARLAVVVAAATLLAYGSRVSQLSEPNRDYPFGGAIEWLAENAEDNEVLLTVPPQRAKIDYSLLYSPVKTYWNFTGQHFSDQPAEKNFRSGFYVALVQGMLPEASYEALKGARQLTMHLRLDYVLIEAGVPSQALVQEQLADFSEIVFEDVRCMLLRVDAAGGRSL